MHRFLAGRPLATPQASLTPASAAGGGTTAAPSGPGTVQPPGTVVSGPTPGEGSNWEGSVWGGTFYPPKGYYDVVFLSPNAYSLRTSDQKVFGFNAGGYLTSVNDRYQNRIAVAYDSLSHLQSATDASGRTLGFTWGLISSSSNQGGFHSYGMGIVSMAFLARTWSFSQGPLPSPNADNGYSKYLFTVVPGTSGNDSTYAFPTFAYSASGAITAEGRYGFAYDNSLRLTAFSDPLGNTTRYAYNATNTVRTNPDGGTQTDFYDAGVLHSEQDEAGFSRTYAYDANYNVVQLTDERGNVQRYAYDGFGNRTSGQDPRQYAAGVKTQTAYNSYNDVTRSVDTRGATTTLARDAGNGTVLSVTDGTGHVVATNTWDPSGVLTGTTAANATTTAHYDDKGNPDTITSPTGRVTLQYLNPCAPNSPTSWTDDRNRTTSVVYDNAGRATVITRSDGATTEVRYDAYNRVLSVKDWLGHTTSYGYDDAGRRTSKVDARRVTERYAYDVCNRVRTITDGRGKVRSYAYARRGEVTYLVLPDGSGERYQYDAGGNQTTRTNALNQTTVYTYDASDNLTKVAYPSGATVQYAYDLDGRTIAMNDATGVSTWGYDLADRVTNLATPQGTQAYAYDPWGRRTGLDQGGGNVTTTTYTAEKLTSLLKSPENETTGWSYDAYGRIQAMNLPNGTVTTYGYDALDRVNAIAHRRANGSAISSEAYVYDAGGNLSSKTVDGVQTTYAYDAVDQLVGESSPGSSVAYAYDANGNRLSRTVNGVQESYSYDNGDKLLGRSGGAAGAFTYGYDACGRTTSVQSAAGTTSLAYDDEDRLTLLVGPGVSQSYAYNGADARVSKSGTGGVRNYRRDGVGVTDPVLSDGQATMVPGISERTNGSTKFSHLDRLGTNAKTTDAGGAVVDSRRYDAFGLPISITNPTNSQKGFASGFGYQEDSETGLKLMGHRYYDPGSGRFITRDPIGSGTNWYAYCDNNPLRSVDPLGLELVKIEAGSAEYNQVTEKIASLRKNGEVDAANSLQAVLDAGKMYVETDPHEKNIEGADGYVFITKDKDGRRSPVRMVFRQGMLLNTRITSEAALLHESVHWREALDQIPTNEQDSNRFTRNYALRREEEARRNRDRDSEGLWHDTATHARDYGRSMAARDVPVLQRFWSSVFGGYIP